MQPTIPLELSKPVNKRIMWANLRTLLTQDRERRRPIVDTTCH